MRKQIHVVPHGDDWAVTRPGQSQPLAVRQTQEQASNVARDVAKEEHLELIVHRPDGRIRSSDSFGQDPNPPKDTEH